MLLDKGEPVFLLACLPEEIDRVEVCSPGELAICRRVGVDPSTVVYSGVNKGSEDIAEAIEYGAELLTAESLRQLGLINATAIAAGKRVRVALRLTSGNQFGMDSENLKRAVAEKKAAMRALTSSLSIITQVLRKRSSQSSKRSLPSLRSLRIRSRSASGCLAFRSNTAPVCPPITSATTPRGAIWRCSPRRAQ